jgi:hypothetical protein
MVFRIEKNSSFMQNADERTPRSMERALVHHAASIAAYGRTGRITSFP